MKLSFVVPAYNEEQYLSRCLEAIFQEVKRSRQEVAEIIVVNNASTDRTREVAASFPGVTIIEEPLKGTSRARQAGFLASTGDLIANVDADTMLPAGWIDTAVQFFSQNPKLVALSGPHVFYDVPETTAYFVSFFYYLTFLVYSINRFVLRRSSFIQGGNFIVRRSALEGIGGYDVRFLFYGDDAEVAHRLHKTGEVVFTFKLPIYASGRRVMVEGKFKMAFLYFINYIWTVVWGRPFTTTSREIRGLAGK